MTPQPNREKLLCPECGAVYYRPGDIKRHLVSKHEYDYTKDSPDYPKKLTPERLKLRSCYVTETHLVPYDGGYGAEEYDINVLDEEKVWDWHQAAIGEEVLKVLEEIEKKFGKITFGTKFWKWHREKVAKLQSQNPSTEEGENHG